MCRVYSTYFPIHGIHCIFSISFFVETNKCKSTRFLWVSVSWNIYVSQFTIFLKISKLTIRIYKFEYWKIKGRLYKYSQKYKRLFINKVYYTWKEVKKNYLPTPLLQFIWATFLISFQQWHTAHLTESIGTATLQYCHLFCQALALNRTVCNSA